MCADEVRRAQTADEREAVYALRYVVYVEEQGKRPAGADHQRRLLKDEADDGATLFYVSEGARVIGTLRVNLGSVAIPNSYASLFSLDRFGDFPAQQFSFTGRLAVLPEFRKSTVIPRLLRAHYDFIRAEGCLFSFIHCAPSLVRLYEHLGYRRYRGNVLDLDVGCQIPMVGVLDGIDHLQNIGSPAVRWARNWPVSSATTAWFERKFPDYAYRPVLETLTANELWGVLGDSQTRPRIPLFDGLEDAEVSEVLRLATRLQYEPGELLMRAGDAGRDLFLVLDGALEVSLATPERRIVLDTLGKGDIAGEMGFLSHQLRTADVSALSAVDVLVITSDFLRVLMRSAPAAAAKLLLNLSVVLSGRLARTTRRLIDGDASAADELTHEEANGIPASA